MSEEQKTQPKMKECARFNAAYEAMKADPNDKNYLALLEALEGDVREDASAFLPLETQEDLEALQKEGKIKWQALDTQKGRMLTIFTTPAQAAKKGAKANLGLNLLAFFKVLTENKEVAGFVVNPYDDQHGYLIERKNAEIILARAKGVKAEVPRLTPPVITKAIRRLFGCAVGVPTPVYEFDAEIRTLGGPDAVMGPIQKKWEKALQSGAFKPTTPVEYVKTIVKDAMTTSFVAGALVKRGPEMVRDANPADCIDRVPYLKEDLVQNTDEYLVALCETLRADMKLTDENLLWVTLANNIGMVAFGAMNFGFGWCLAKCFESEGKEAMAALKDRQRAFLEKLKAFEAQQT